MVMRGNHGIVQEKHDYITGVIAGGLYIIVNNLVTYDIRVKKYYDEDKAFALRYPAHDKSKLKKKTVYTRKEVDMMLEYDKRLRNSKLVD